MIKPVVLLALFWANTVLSVPNNQFSDFFNTLESFSANFTQYTYSDTNALIHTTSGTFIFNHPKQLRWHTIIPNEQILLLNNNELWLVDVELEQASLQQTKDLSKTPLYWLVTKPNSLNNPPIFSHQKDNIDWYQANQHSSQYQQLLFGFEDKTLRAVSVINELEQTILILFDQVSINPTIKPQFFKLNLDPAFDVIR
jgi:outer membrane lipoprotein carrier protein